ncbi:MFS transporter [Kribbella deserti]|uniref:MFS transporter n=1 Tax=Kribbella deserti TaxID=1926257 RepID=A0ABV6QS72_9ACTN
MSTIKDSKPATWAELLGPARLSTSLVLAGGVALHAINIFLTTSLLPTAIEEIGGERLYAWSTTVFMIASVISSMFVSRLLIRRGPLVAYLTGLTPFIVGTLISAASPTMAVLLAGRAVQGIGGGLLAGLGYAVIRSAYPERLWAKATALVSAMWGVGTLAGPAIGGLFAQLGRWRMAFVLLAALGLLIAVIAPRALPRAEVATSADAVPLTSLVLLTVATALISLAGILTEPLQIAGLILAGIVVVIGFVQWERRAPARVLPVSTYTARSTLKWSYLAVAVLAMGTVTEAFTPLFGQRLAGLSPLIAGFLGAAVSLGWSVTMLFSSDVTKPSTLRRMRIGGPLVLAAGLAITAAFQREDASAGLVVIWALGLVLAGAGIGIAFPHIVVAVMSSTPDEDEASKAAAGINTVELMALSFGSAIGGVLVNLGGGSMLHSAQYLLFGFAAFAAVGGLFASRSDPRPATID